MAPPYSTGLGKKIVDEQRTLVCLDETAFYLLPSVGYTWAPKGQTPRLSEVYSHRHLSAISAITPAGKLYLKLQRRAFNGHDVVHFVCHLLRQIPGKLLLLWDNASIHRGQDVQALQATDPQRELWIQPFPAYAPELNPDEGIWQHLKNVELPNLCCADLPDLTRQIRKAVGRLRQKPHIIRACFKQVGLLF